MEMGLLELEELAELADETFISVFDRGACGICESLYNPRWVDMNNYDVKCNSYTIEWEIEDFSFIGSVVTGFSKTGKRKIQVSKELKLPKNNALGQSITGIGKDAFRDQDIEKICIPALDPGVSYTIGASAFSNNCMKSIDFPCGVEAIESSAFLNNRLEKVYIPSSIQKIGNCAFKSNCINELIFRDSLKPLYIDNFAFSDNEIEEVILPRNIVKAPSHVFMNNKGRVRVLTNNPVHLEESQYIRESEYQIIKLIEAEKWNISDFSVCGTVISGFSELGKIKFKKNKCLIIPNKNIEDEFITEISNNAFMSENEYISFGNDSVYVPDGIRSLVLPKHIKKIGDNAFRYNNINQIVLPKEIEEIGKSAFAGNKIEHINLPKSLKKIGEAAFSVNRFKEVLIPGHIKEIPYGLFGCNTVLTRIFMEEGVESVGDYAFVGAPISSLEIPSSIRVIGERAFAYHRIKELIIPGTVKEIKNSAFRGNPKYRHLKTLILEDGIEHISKWSFKDNLIQEVKLPSSVIKLDKSVFSDNSNKSMVKKVKVITENYENIKYESKHQEIIVNKEIKLL